MTSEITYAEVKFKNESTSLGTASEPPAAPKEKTSLHKSKPGFPKALFLSVLILLLLLAISFLITFIIFFQKYSQLLKEKKALKEVIHAELKCMKENSIMKGSSVNTEKDWSCCPETWKPFRENCYFISTDTKNWTDSKNNCSAMQAHLLVINTKEEHDFIIKDLYKNSAYYVGLSDPEGNGAWQWVDQTPYNASATFWHPGEPSNPFERCVILSSPSQRRWGWNDVPCEGSHRLICKMKKIHL